jgi:hypothetical protein
MSRRQWLIAAGLGLLLGGSSQALVEPEIEGWQAMTGAAREVCQVPGTELFPEALEELGELGAALMDAPLHDLMVELEQRRGLKFKYFTPWHIKDREELRAWLKVQLDKEYPASLVAQDEAMLKAFGLVPKDFALIPFLENLLTSQIGGVYDPDKDQFFLVDVRGGRSLRDRARDGLIAAAGLSMGDQISVVTIHELDHALGGQHFDLKKILAEARDWSTDRQMAAQALIEGDATFVMIDHQNKRPASEAGGSTFVQGADMMARMMGVLAVLPIPVPGMGEFGSAPLYFQKGLIFPYFNGAELITELRHSAYDWSAVNTAYSMLPHSTEQIYHPGDYLYVSRKPHEWDFSRLPTEIGPWSRVMDDTGGEFFLRVVLEQYGVKEYARAAEGWDGDRLRVYRHQSDAGRLAFVWALRWDSDSDAREFAQIASRLPFRLETGPRTSVLSQGFDPTTEQKLRAALR